MKHLIRLIVLLLLISGCSAQKRLNRLERNHPELFRQDTVFEIDSFEVKGLKLDTIFKNQITDDTVTIVKDNVILKYFNDGKTVYLAGETKTVQKIIKYPVVIKSAVIRETTNKIAWWVYLIGGIMALTILLLAIKK